MKKPIVLWGGTDVDSALYGQPHSKFAQKPDQRRDEKELEDIAIAIATQTPVVGVCRGAQLLCVTNGGSLYQHSRPHVQTHSITMKDGQEFAQVQAGHHQIMNPKGDFVLYGWNPNETLVWVDDNTVVRMKGTAEIVWFPKHQQLAIQPHPEWAEASDPFVKYINGLMESLGIDYSF